ncbi:MAG: NAD-dependent epimerase/dehydratase family protein [Planctomycetes bacterium]|nr:NAD-dependent epimerase/dehydratase family protein [Planctomycetota bacterium]
MKAFVTGAAGFVGGALVKLLISRGYEVKALLRETSNLANLPAEGFTRVTGDLLKPETYREALRECEYVFHVAGKVSFFPEHRMAVYSVNREATRLMIAELRASPNLKKAVFTATIGTIGFAESSGTVLDETSPWNAGPLDIHYITSKKQGEDLVMQAAREGLPFAIVNPSVILGPGDINNSSTFVISAVMKRLAMIYVPAALNAVDVDDVAMGHLLALEKGRAGERYILGGQNIGTRDFLKLAAKIAGVWFPLIGVPKSLALIFGFTAGRFMRFLPMNVEAVKMSAEPWVYSIEKAREELGYDPRPLEETIKRTVDDLRARGIA